MRMPGLSKGESRLTRLGCVMQAQIGCFGLSF